MCSPFLLQQTVMLEHVVPNKVVSTQKNSTYTTRRTNGYLFYSSFILIAAFRRSHIASCRASKYSKAENQLSIIKTKALTECINISYFVHRTSYLLWRQRLHASPSQSCPFLLYFSCFQTMPCKIKKYQACRTLRRTRLD